MVKLWNEANLTPNSFGYFCEQLTNLKEVKKENKVSFRKFYKRLEAFLIMETPDYFKDIADGLIEFIEWDRTTPIDLDSLEMFVRIL